MTPSLVLLVAAALALALALTFADGGNVRRSLLVRGIAGLIAIAAMLAASSLDLVILVVLFFAVVDSMLAGSRDVASRLRAPVVSVVLLALTLLLARVQGPEMLVRFAAVGLVAGVAAGVGLLPYVHRLEPDAQEPESAFVWIGFVGPVLAATLLIRAREFLPAGAGGYFGSMLIGLGLLNILWGTLAAWRTAGDQAAWHYSFMADWGLALCGFGIIIADGQSAALLILIGIVLGRFPLLFARRETPERDARSHRRASLLVGAMLAGAAPFAGFAARLLLLRGATDIFWPLAVVLAVGMLLWLPASLRLGRTVGPLRGRQALALGVVLAINGAVGLYPLPILSLAGL